MSKKHTKPKVGDEYHGPSLIVMLGVVIDVAPNGEASGCTNMSVEGEEAYVELLGSKTEQFKPLVDAFRAALCEALGAELTGESMPVISARVGRA